MSLPRVPDGISFLPRLTRVTLDQKGQLTQQAFSYIFGVLQNLVEKLNGRVSFGNATHASWAGNLDGQWNVELTSPAVGDTVFRIEHDLGRIPVFFFFNANQICSVYCTDSDRASWTPTALYLRCSASSAKLRLLIV